MFKLIIKRSLLIIIGIILSLVLLECGLRLIGLTISYYQQYKNNKALRNKSQYTIMCLGESTTAGYYPVQLQQILNEKYPNKFSVIDCGIPGTDLKTILDLLDVNINKYNPDIAICMMGINDGFISEEKSYIKKMNNTKHVLKIHKLFILLKRHIMTLNNENKLFASEISNKNILEQELNQAINYFKIKENEKAIKLFNKIIEKNENLKENVYPYLVSLYSYEESTREKALNIAVEAIYKNFKTDRQKYYEIAIILYNDQNKFDEIIVLTDKMLLENIDVSLRIYTIIKNLISKDKFEKIKQKLEKDNYAFQAIDYLTQKDYQKAKEYFDKAEEIRLNFPNTETYNLYKLIIKKLIDNNIKTICMQYPIRSIKPLQEQLKNESYYDKITFISNEKLFKDALMKKNYDEIFNDQFAGDFGHYTYIGNILIAKNIVNTLEEILNIK